MQILPVIDLKDGEVVRGVAGQRATYQRVQSLLAPDPTVPAVATAFASQLQVDTIYVADLDAIAGQEPNWLALEQIHQAGLQIWLDAGVESQTRARQLLDYAEQHVPLAGVIVGLESVPDSETLADLWQLIGGERAIFSLDLKQGQPLTSSAGWDGQTPEEIAHQAIEIGFQRMIVLDLSAVGMDQGTPVESLCHNLHVAYPEVVLISGGGIRGLPDLQRLADHGCTGALVASALHDGRLGTAELQAAALLGQDD